MGKRIGQMLVAVAVLAAAGALARPAQVQLPPGLDAGTPVVPAPPRTDADDGLPLEQRGDDAPAGEAASGPVTGVRLHALGPAGLMPRALPLEIEAGWGHDGEALDLAAGRLALALPHGDGVRLLVADAEGLRGAAEVALADGAVDLLALAPTGERLAWLEQTADNDLRLGSAAVGGGEPAAPLALPSGFRPWEVRHLGGEQVAVVGVTLAGGDPDGLLDAQVEVVVADTAAGSLQRLLLPQVSPAVDVAAPGQAQGTAGLAWDLDRRRLYVAHPDTEAVTVVDLEALAVEYTVGPPAPELQQEDGRSVELGRSSAHLDRDGARLFVSRARTVDRRHADGTVQTSHLPGDLVVYDTLTGDVVRRGPPLPERVADVSADGQLLVLAPTRFAVAPVRRVRVVDAESLAERFAVAVEGETVDAAFRADGDLVVVARDAAGVAVRLVDGREGVQLTQRRFPPGTAVLPAVGLVLEPLRG